MFSSLFPTLTFSIHLILPNSGYILVYHAILDNYQNVHVLVQYIGQPLLGQTSPHINSKGLFLAHGIYWLCVSCSSAPFVVFIWDPD